MATALAKTNTVDMSGLAIQATQIKDTTGAAVNTSELTALTGSSLVLPSVTAVASEVNELDSSAKFVFKDDFYGTWLITDAAQGPGDFWSATAGAGTGNQTATTVAASLNGHITIKSASDDGTNAQNGTMLTGINLGWKTNSGGLAIEARLKVDAITDVHVGVGFTDTISTTVELPIFMNAADLDSDATDAFGVIFDTDATNAKWTVGGVANGTDVTPTISTLAPVADTFVIVRVEATAAGVITGYINGTSIGSVSSGVTVTTALTPYITVNNRGAAQRVVTIDYVKVEQNRV